MPGSTLPIFAGMIKDIPVCRIIEGILFHRIKQRTIFFLALKLVGMRRILQLKPLSKQLDELELQLSNSDGQWIVGAQFTLADVSMMVIFDRLREGDWLSLFLSDKRLHINAYWQSLQKRTSYQSGVSAFTHPLVVKATEEIRRLEQTDVAFKNSLPAA